MANHIHAALRKSVCACVCVCVCVWGGVCDSMSVTIATHQETA